MIVCVIRVLISKKQHLSNLNISIKFSSLLRWIMLHKIFYLLVLLKLYIWIIGRWKLPLRRSENVFCLEYKLSIQNKLRIQNRELSANSFLKNCNTIFHSIQVIHVLSTEGLSRIWLIYLFPMHSFSISWKHQKTVSG